MKVVYNGQYGPSVSVGLTQFLAGEPTNVEAEVGVKLIAKPAFSEYQDPELPPENP